MSNLVAKMQNKHKRVNGTVAKELLQNAQSTKTIDFGSRILPNALLIDVKNETMKIGQKDLTMNEITEIYDIGNTYESNCAFLKLLESFDESSIDKVIMDNHTDFKIKTFIEFKENIRSHIARFKEAHNIED